MPNAYTSKDISARVICKNSSASAGEQSSEKELDVHFVELVIGGRWKREEKILTKKRDVLHDNMGGHKGIFMAEDPYMNGYVYRMSDDTLVQLGQSVDTGYTEV